MARFMLQPHFTYSLLPLFAAHDYKKIRSWSEPTPSALPVRITVRESEVQQIEMPLAVASKTDAIGLGHGMLDHQDLCEYYVKGESWMQFGEDAIVNAQEQEEETKADLSVTTYKVTMSEALKCCFFVNAAGVMRFHQHSLVMDSQGILSGKLSTSSPLIGPTAERLGMALRVNPCPLACRSLDMVPLFGRALAITQKILKAPSAGRTRAPALDTGKTPSRDTELLTNMLYQMILLRMTGRIQNFAMYWRERCGGVSAKPMVPRRQDLEGFLLYMEGNTGKVPVHRSVAQYAAQGEYI